MPTVTEPNKNIFLKVPKFLNAEAVKLFAIIFMVMDHFAVCVVPALAGHFASDASSFFALTENVMTTIQVLRGFGRLAFPIFLFFLVDGLTHTSNIKKYAARLLVFAFVSEIPFDMAVFGEMTNFSKQNTLFTLFLALVTIAGVDNVLTIFSEDRTKRIMLSLSIIMFACVAAYFLKCDYGYVGILSAIAMYFFRYDKIKSIFAGSIILMLGFSNELYAVFSVIPLLFYTGKKGTTSKVLQYAFYIFYPLHLLILVGLKGLF